MNPVSLAQCHMTTACRLVLSSFISPDSGLVVPSISYELHKQLVAVAEHYGLSLERRLEMTGVCASQMALTLLGGPNR